MKAVQVWRKYHQDRRDRAECLHALDEIAPTDLLDEFFEKAKGELLCDKVCQQKGPALRLGNCADLVIEFRLHFRLREIT